MKRPPWIAAALLPLWMSPALMAQSETLNESDRDPVNDAPVALRSAEVEQVLSRGVPSATVPRTEDAPVIDGILDDDAWESAVVIDDFRQVNPDEGEQLTERTEVRITYDDDALYVGFRCFDSEAAGIIATEMRRDAGLNINDRVSFLIDTFFDRRNAFFFEMNPAGARVDALIENNRRFRRDWDGIWYGRSTRDAEGWSAEFAIPFKTLSFDPNSTAWSFNASRFIRRKNEGGRWATPSRDKGFGSIADAGVIEGLVGMEQGAGIDVKPYGLFKLKRDHEGDRNGVDVDAGLDVFYKLTQSLTLSLTVNTDFAETEVDERQVNLTRFPLFFPEKRDFFLQDAGIFNFGGINRNPLPFHSRRIGIGRGGRILPILVGAKLTGRVGDVNLGLLDVQMQEDNELGNKNYLVGRASVNVFAESSIGAIFTHGNPGGDEESSLGGFDFNYRNGTFMGDKTLTGNLWGQRSSTEGVDGGESAYGFKLGYPNDRIDWQIGFSHIDDDFNAALGFVPRRGIREYFGNWRYRWRPESDFIRSIESGVFGLLVTDLDETTESARARFNLIEIDTEAGDELELNYTREREVLSNVFEIQDGIEVPVGDYWYDRYGIVFNSSDGRAVSVFLAHEFGDFFTGDRTDYVAGANWRISDNLNVSGSFELNDVDLPEGDFITRLVSGRINVLFTPDLSWSTLAQFDNVSNSIGVNSRVRWIIEPGNEVFFVFNQSINRNGNSYQVRQSEFTTKVGWTFRF